MKTQLRSDASPRGFTFIELIIVITIVGLLVGIAIPRAIQARDSARMISASNDLKQTRNAKDQWALDQKKTNGTVIADMTVLNGYLKDGRVRGAMKGPSTPNAVGTPTEANLPEGHSPGTYASAGVIPAP